MKKVIFATGNQGKMKEIREILGDLDIELLSLKDAGIQADIVEDGKTFEENAQIKAKTICDLTGEIVLADDSGLEIDYLNKEPGIYSATWARIPPTGSKTQISSNGWRACRMNRGRHVSYAPSPPLFRTAP